MYSYAAKEFCECRDQASDTCSGLGTRLPTPREYAEWAVTRGATIRESAYTGKKSSDRVSWAERDDNLKDGFYLILDGDSNIDFYINSSQYKPDPEIEGLKNVVFVTSQNYGSNFGYSLGFDGLRGVFWFAAEGRNGRAASYWHDPVRSPGLVRCVISN